MVIEEVQLFRQLSTDFMRELGNTIQEESYPANQTVFNQGDAADSLYILVGGGINLVVRDKGSMNFMVEIPGEVFGWSSLVEAKKYTASAVTYSPTRVMKINTARLEHIFERHPRDAYVVMRRLAGVVGKRLMNTYRDLMRLRSDDSTPSYG